MKKSHGIILFYLIALFALSLSAHTQIVLQPKVLNFGEVTQQSEKVIDIVIENTGDTKDFLLRNTFSHEYEIKLTSKEILPHDHIVLRVKFNPRSKGIFSEKIELWFANSQKPLILPVTADVRYVNVNGTTPCPDFSNSPAECCAENMFIVEVVELQSQKPIQSATVKVIEENTVQLKMITPAAGKVSHSNRIGYYTILAEKKGYKSASITGYINRNHNTFKLELEKLEEEVLAEKPIFTEEPPRETIDIAEVPTPPITKDSIPLSAFLPEDQFAPNNIVFLLDISGSMSVGDKLDVMKASLKELTKALRPIDRVTLISYAGDAKVILPTTSGSATEEIIAIVEALHAQGKTSGAKAFKKAFAICKKHFIDNGNNQLIVITDGAFNPSDQTAIEKLVGKAFHKNMRTTIVAIEPSEFAKEKLTLVSSIGQGSFLPVLNLTDAHSVLINELKKQSAK